MPVTSRVRVAVLGCADIALRRMLPAMAASADVELIAVASRDAHKANETARRFGCAAVHGYDALLARDDVDAVYVPLPAALHDVWVEAALRAGKHVLAEKPLTTSQVRTAELLRLASARGLALVENVLFVHHGQHAAVRALVRDGAIGQTRSLQASFAVPARPEHDIRYRAALGGGALWDVGVYPVRAALYLLGSPLTVAGAVLMSDPGREVDTSGAALLRSEAGAVAHLTFGIGHAYHSGYELRGSEGRITVDRAFTPPADHRPVLRLERGTRTEEIALAPEDQVAAAVSAFARAVREGGAPSDDPVLDQASLLDAIRRTATGSGTGRAGSGH
ncbi:MULTISPECIES: Gfo/Idh/MocA family oxidoreductase [unclassified Streptomyces]|uniref:Gfo/Idh/MocA family oxidoreductase n=1 Tax=Streptomyces sp. NBC_00060 TaxID=2975636 RepID=A0AAU2HDM5_9ACTN